jgi:hypothetical protein
MALNLADRLAVRHVIVDRCTAAAIKYALYLLGNGASTVPQKNWAKSAMLEASLVGDRVSFHVLDQPDFINNGSDITDAVLQSAVETAINNRFIV